MTWHRSPIGRWHHLEPGSLPGYLTSACGAWSPTDDEAARAYSRPERPVDACGNCALMTRSTQEEQQRALAESKRWQRRRRRARLEAAMADGTPRHEAAAELGLTTRTAREHARALKGGG